MLGFRRQGFHFPAVLPLKIGLILFLGIFLLAACQSKPASPTSTEAGGTPASSPTVTRVPVTQSTGALTGVPYPQPTQAGSSAYPSPPQGSVPTSAGAYPGLQAGVPTFGGVYPAPGSGANQPQTTPTPYPDPSKTPTGAYPAPAETNGASPGNPYPGASPFPGWITSTAVPPAATNQPAATTQLIPTNPFTATPLPTATSGLLPPSTALPTASPTATFTPSATLTPTAMPVPSLRTDLLATDPTTVQLASGKPELIVFFAYWDGNSRIMIPILLNLQDQFGSQANFVYLDRDDPATSQLERDLYFEPYGTLPQTFLLDANGKILRKWAGVIQPSDLQQAIQAALGG